MSYNGPYPLILLSSQNASSSASISFASQIISTYSSYLVVFSNVIPATAGAALQMQVNTGSGYISSNYQSGINRNVYNSTTVTNTNSTSSFLLSGPLSTTAGASGYFDIFNATNGDEVMIAGQVSMIDNATSNLFISLIGGYNTATNITAIQFAMSSGNISSGTFSLFGILE